MPLGDLQKKLYSESDELEKRKLAEDEFDVKKKLEQQVGQDDHPSTVTDEVWLKQKELVDERTVTPEQVQEHTRQNWKLAGSVIGVVLFLVLAVLAVIKYREAAFVEEKIVISIQGPQEIKSGQEVNYIVSITNNNRAALKNTIMHVGHSEDLVLSDQPTLLKEGMNAAKFDVGALASKETKRFEIPARAYGERDKEVFFNVALNYEPENFSSQFEKKAQLASRIAASLVNVSLISTREAASGELVEVQMIVRNESTEDVEDISVRIDYPEGFSYRESDQPVASGNNVWQFPLIKKGDQIKVMVRGSLDGGENTTKTFIAALGKGRIGGSFLKYDENETIVKIVSQRLQLEQSINGKRDYVGDAGEVLLYEISFRNNSPTPLRDFVLVEKISGPVLDESQIDPEKGFYDNVNDQITWRAADVPELEVLNPGQSGSVTFRAPIMSTFPMESEKDMNFVIQSQAEISSPDVDSPIGQNKIVYSRKTETKINSKLILEVVGYYNDGELPNTGPLPLTPGQETTFTLRFNIKNTSNNLRNVTLATSMPSGVKWTGKMFPDDRGFTVEDRTNLITWNLGTIDAGTGFIKPIRFFAFQVGVRPSSNQIGQILTLLNETTIKGTDTFTNEQVSYKFKGINTNGISDIAGGDGKVRDQ